MLYKAINIFLQYLRKKFRIVLFHDSTLEPILTTRFSRLRLLIFIFLFSFVVIVATSLLIAFTSLRQYIPGYGELEDRKKMIQLYRLADSISTVLHINNLYLDSVMKIVKLSTNLSMEQMEMLDKNAISSQKNLNTEIMNPGTATSAVLISFAYRPSDGVVVRKFDMAKGHFGIDVACRQGSPVLAVSDGVVLFSGWMPEYGNLIMLQHKQNIITLYSHLSMQLVRRGENVKSGQVIALSGNTGTHTTGPHLHFEIWIDQKAVDPLNFFAY